MRCPRCNTELSERVAVCPSCEAVIKDPRELKRRKENVPVIEDRYTIVSHNYNGTFSVKQARDGSFVCTCPSFLLQNGTENTDTPFSTCKHIRRYINENNITPAYTGREPSEWQRLLLKTMGVKDTAHLSNSQAYFLVSELLALRGTNYGEIAWFLKNHRKPTLLPLVYFGIELEGNVKNIRDLCEALIGRNNISVARTGYTGNTRAANEWRVSDDASVTTRQGFSSIELVSPKLFGWRGLAQLKEVLNTWNSVGAAHVATAGTHVHIDGYGLDDEFRKRLAFAWAKVEIPHLWYLVAPSRRNNSYCKPLNEDFLADMERYRGDRYRSLNFSASVRHGTVEFRLFHCSTDFTKISSWAILMMMFFEAVKNGLTFRDIPDDFQGFLDGIGFGEDASALLRATRKHLLERYGHWKKDAEMHPGHVPGIAPPRVDNIEEIGRIRRLEVEIMRMMDLIEYLRTGRLRWVGPPQWVSQEYADMWRLAAGNTQKVINIQDIAVSEDGSEVVVDGRTVAVVNDGHGVLCSCSYARRNSNRCYHARWAARCLFLKLFEERLEAFRQELAEIQGGSDEQNGNQEQNESNAQGGSNEQSEYHEQSEYCDEGGAAACAG